jgi:hypothetical protein
LRGEVSTDAFVPSGDFVTVEKSMQRGNPDLEAAGTSHVRRKNGLLRQWCKRFTRLTYAFSKKKENLRAALALHFWFYDFARVHGSLRVTPAMEPRIADHVWTIAEWVARQCWEGPPLGSMSLHPVCSSNYASELLMLVKTLVTALATVLTLATDASATKATNNAYSTKS